MGGSFCELVLLRGQREEQCLSAILLYSYTLSVLFVWSLYLNKLLSLVNSTLALSQA
jgi:hypothetical protein